MDAATVGGCMAEFVCRECGTTERPCHARGLCNTCYRRDRRQTKPDKRKPKASEGASSTVDNTHARITSAKLPDTITPDELLLQHGMQSPEWVQTNAKANTWTSADGSTAHQLTVHAKRVVDLADYFTIPEPSGKKIRRLPERKNVRGTPELIPLFPDPHCPLQEQVLCDAAESWLREFRPKRWVCLGDEQDASAFSRHRKNPAFDFTANEGIEGTYRQLERWSVAAGGVDWWLLPGNHSYWLDQRVRDNLPALHGLRQGGTGVELLAVENVLNLSSLHGSIVKADGEYFEATLRLLPDLILLHGNRTGKHGGATMEIDGWEGTSIGQGHDHKLAVTAITKRLANNTEVQRWAISAGTMASRNLGYDPRRNVNQGFIVIVAWPDGGWHPEIVPFNPQTGVTSWRDWRYTP